MKLHSLLIFLLSVLPTPFQKATTDCGVVDVSDALANSGPISAIPINNPELGARYVFEPEWITTVDLSPAHAGKGSVVEGRATRSELQDAAIVHTYNVRLRRFFFTYGRPSSQYVVFQNQLDGQVFALFRKPLNVLNKQVKVLYQYLDASEFSSAQNAVISDFVEVQYSMLLNRVIPLLMNGLSALVAIDKIAATDCYGFAFASFSELLPAEKSDRLFYYYLLELHDAFTHAVLMVSYDALIDSHYQAFGSPSCVQDFFDVASDRDAIIIDNWRNDPTKRILEVQASDLRNIPATQASITQLSGPGPLLELNTELFPDDPTLRERAREISNSVQNLYEQIISPITNKGIRQSEITQKTQGGNFENALNRVGFFQMTAQFARGMREQEEELGVEISKRPYTVGFAVEL